MSKLFNKNKNKFLYEVERIKNNSQTKNIHKNILNKSSNLYKDYLFSSPYKIISKNKKNYINIMQNNYKTNNNNNQNNHSNKNNSNKILTYNKSFELNINSNNIITDNNLKNGNLYFNYNNNKNTNNSVILNKNTKKLKNKLINKSVAKNSNSYNKISNKKNIYDNKKKKKLDEKFKSLESNIIDKQYENDIDHDEMIIATDKAIHPHNKSTTLNSNKNQINIYSNKLTNILGSNSKRREKDNRSPDYDQLLNIFENKNDTDFDEKYLLNASFEEKRSDFNIMYSNNYDKNVVDDLLSLEIKLIIEKMLDLQNSYHKEFNLIINQYNKNYKIFNLLIEKIRIYQKKKHVMRKIIEKKDIENNIYNFISVHHNINKHETNKLNKDEINLLKYTISGKDTKRNVNDKEKLKQIFKILIFDKYPKICGKMNNIENKIILGLMKKFKYDIKKNNETKYNNNNDKTKLYYTNNKSNKSNSISIPQNKNIINKNKNDGNSNTKRKKKNFLSSSQPKQFKYYNFNFKNLK